MGRVAQVIDLFRRSPDQALARITGALARRVRHKAASLRDQRRASYLQNDIQLTPLAFHPFLIDDAQPHPGVDHIFDLLGSGPVRVGPPALLLSDRINPANLEVSSQINGLIAQGEWGLPDYQPLDWQTDFKSAYRWSEQDHFLSVPFGHQKGVDIKVPWELSRLQHLIPMILYAQKGGDARYIKEVRAQMLDFISNNPPRFGVNWRCPMDVAIRTVNMALSYSLLSHFDIKMDGGFEKSVANAVQAQVDHILAHLEWSEDARGNHYFANIQGLLFGAAVLPQTPRNIAILAFAIQEFFGEAQRQFLQDGTSFEGSTGYHRLSAEMLYWGTGLVMSLSPQIFEKLDCYDSKAIKVRPPFAPASRRIFDMSKDGIVIGEDLKACLQKSATFIEQTMRPEGQSLKLGDYDSGRLVKVFPPREDGEEDILDHRPALSLSAALFDTVERGDGLLLQALCAGKRLQTVHCQTKTEVVEERVCPRSAVDEVRHVFDIDVPAQLETACYPDFGLYIWRGEDFLMTMRCFDRHGEREWGHFHDDNLALTLWANGESLIGDPGTYLYTADPSARRLYQSASAHFVPRLVGCAAMKFGPSLFEAQPLADGACLAFGATGGQFELKNEDWALVRRVKISSKQIEITDMSLTEAQVLDRESYQGDIKETLGYGRKSTRPVYSL